MIVTERGPHIMEQNSLLMRLFLLFCSLLFVSEIFAQKLKEKELLRYAWNCTNCPLTEQALLNKDTLHLIWYFDYQREEPVSLRTGVGGCSSCFSLYFEDTTGFVSAYAVARINAERRSQLHEIADSSLYHALKADKELVSPQSKEWLKQLDTAQHRFVTVAWTAHPKQEFFLYYYNGQWERRQALSARHIVGATDLNERYWKLDPKEQLLYFSTSEAHTSGTYFKVRRIRKDRIELVRQGDYLR